MKRISQNKIFFFQENIIKWFNENGRDFPWRKKNLTPYQLVIAEVLLQRTKAETISKFYPLFLKKYPSWKSLNKTRLAALEKVLKPIGLYKQRAALLKKLAKEMILLKGILPKEKAKIEKLPFAGQYITNAILQFVYNKPAPLLDINMARVLERFFEPRKLSDIRYDSYLQELAWKIIDHKKSKKINWGILDYAAKICTIKNPSCIKCALRIKCTKFNFT
jgi:A/G-specific adenine glycosylase